MVFYGFIWFNMVSWNMEYLEYLDYMIIDDYRCLYDIPTYGGLNPIVIPINNH